MPSLPELQREFVVGVLQAPSPDFLRHVVPGQFPADRHFQVYRNNVFENLTAALKAVYPVTGRLVGEGFFRYAAATYIALHPPHCGNLHDFGGEFAGFLANFPPARELVYLPDVARLEWAWHQSFHAADSAPLALTALATIPPEQYANLKFTLHPSVRLVSSPYPVLHIWQVNQEEYQGNQDVNLGEGGARLLVIRRRQVEIEPLGEGDYALLSSFSAGATFAQAAEAALHAQTDYALTTALRRHVTAGTLAGFDC
jgi:hypothetical protein